MTWIRTPHSYPVNLLSASSPPGTSSSSLSASTRWRRLQDCWAYCDRRGGLSVSHTRSTQHFKAIRGPSQIHSAVLTTLTASKSSTHSTFKRCATPYINGPRCSPVRALGSSHWHIREGITELRPSEYQTESYMRVRLERDIKDELARGATCLQRSKRKRRKL